MKLRCVLGVSDRAGLSDDSRLTPSPMLPSVPIKTSASRNCPLRDSIPGPHLPLSTLHVGTCVPPRMTRGQTGSLLLICKRLSLLASMPVSLAHNDMDSPCSYGIGCARLRVCGTQSRSRRNRDEHYTSWFGYRK